QYKAHDQYEGRSSQPTSPFRASSPLHADSGASRGGLRYLRFQDLHEYLSIGGLRAVSFSFSRVLGFLAGPHVDPPGFRAPPRNPMPSSIRRPSDASSCGIGSVVE
ncbi:hypothetical protein BHE74_00031026, partial [Ensete ventricosum]